MTLAQGNGLFQKKPFLLFSSTAGDKPGEFGTLNTGDAIGPYGSVVDYENNIVANRIINPIIYPTILAYLEDSLWHIQRLV